MEAKRPELPLVPVEREIMGAVAAILLPFEKLKEKSVRGEQFEKEVHDFFLTTFSGYTVASGNISGHWKDAKSRDHYGEHREYRVAIPEKTAFETLELYLATLAHELQEECIYIEFRGEARLVYAAK